jgi:hypothetical protein
VGQITDLKDAIVSAVINVTGANIASYYPDITWSNNVFYGREPLIHNMNRGKQLICHIWRDRANYNNESDGNGGSLITQWNLELYAFRKPSTPISDEEEFEEILEEIFGHIIASIRNRNGLNLSNGDDLEIERIALVPFGFVYKTRMTIVNSWINTNR